MNNPFLINGAMTATASINKLIVGEMPTQIVTQDLVGKSALEIFSTDLLIGEIKKRANQLHIQLEGIEEKMLPFHLESCLLDEDIAIKNEAHRISKQFGERLAIILLCLKRGNQSEQKLRSDWTPQHWEYWNQLETIILVGGLANSKLGETLQCYVNQLFEKENETSCKIILGYNSGYAGIRGCMHYIKEETEKKVNLIFDFGQSFTKRSYMQKNNQGIREVIILDNILSQQVEWDIQESKREQQEAILLNDNFLGIIEETIKEVKDKDLTIGKEIVISIANYVDNGKIVNRGGYGKLRLIADNYSDYLERTLLEKGYEFKIMLVHDGTAMAAGYNGYEKAVCISLGTAFGVGFPLEIVK